MTATELGLVLTIGFFLLCRNESGQESLANMGLLVIALFTLGGYFLVFRGIASLALS